jgi:osmotically-inducible protein OsmY
VTPTDSELRHDVSQELKRDAHVAGAEIGVSVEAGVVKLTGTVRNFVKRTAAEEAARRVVGVADVSNELQVSAPAGSDAEIAHALQHTLASLVTGAETRIRSSVSAGFITLEGDLDNWAQHADLDNAVRDLAGVRGVTNRLAILPATVSPDEVRSSIEDALERHAEREASRIDVDVRDGRVRLRGSVHSASERAAIVGAAHSIPGVQSVDDQLDIEPFMQ